MMRKLDHLAPVEDLSGAWCDANSVTSSLMEAISFIAPVLEKFFIRTVAEALAGQQDPDLDRRCRAFIREEAVHSHMHRRLNASLLKYLCTMPPGFAMVQSLLNGARQHLPLSFRLLLATSLEHFAAVLSKGYLNQEAQWDFRCAFTKELFAQHAREELAHRSVVFDLWLSQGKTGRVGRTLIVLTILLAGLAYVSAAVPWILHHKTGKRLTGTLSAFAGFVMRKRLNITNGSSLRELFLFACGDYHPECLIAKGATAGIEQSPLSITKESQCF